MAHKTPVTKTITSRSFTLTTNSFCFDFTWRKVEIEEPPPAPARPSSKETFAQMLNRTQISGLLCAAPAGALPAARPIPVSLGPLAPPSGAYVGRNYRQAGMLSPKTDDSDYYV
jgi:hypothetical protein